MKKALSAGGSVLLALAFLLIPVLPANADLLSLYADENLKGTRITSTSCNFDFTDNIEDSGSWNGSKAYVSIWNNTIIHGDERIAKILNKKPVYAFAQSNAADHATCLG